MEHGKIYPKKTRVGDGTVYLKHVRFCQIHGEIDLFTCDDWDAKHAGCASPLEKPATVGLELPKVMRKAA